MSVALVAVSLPDHVDNSATLGALFVTARNLEEAHAKRGKKRDIPIEGLSVVGMQVESVRGA